MLFLHRALFALSCCTVLLRLTLCFSDVYFLPRSFEDLPQNTKQTLLEYVDMQVAYVNYPALQRDFPFLNNQSNETIKRWILDNCAYVSPEQKRLNGIRHTEIITDGRRSKRGYRQPGWERAAAMPVNNLEGLSAGLIDVKGVGLSRELSESTIQKQEMEYQTIKNLGNNQDLNQLRTKSHSDGLMSAGEALAELVKAMALQNIFDVYNLEHQTYYETVEAYFVLIFPRNSRLLKENNRGDYLGLVGRQAHVGRLNSTQVYNCVDTIAPNNLYTDFFGKKQVDYTGCSVDMGGVCPVYGDWGRRFSSDCCELTYAYETIDAFMNGNEQSVENHVLMMAGPPIQKVPHLRVKTPISSYTGLEDIQVILEAEKFEIFSNSYWEKLLLLKENQDLKIKVRGGLI